MKTNLPLRHDPFDDVRAFTLAEVAIALAISALLLSGIVVGFLQSAQQAEWSGYNMAAQALAMQGIEQARSANWDPQAPTPVDFCVQSNFPPATTNILDVPVSLTNNITYATNTWTITTLTNSTSYPLKMIRVDTTWRFMRFGVPRSYTNTVATLRAPNQ